MSNKIKNIQGIVIQNKNFNTKHILLIKLLVINIFSRKISNSKSDPHYKINII